MKRIFVIAVALMVALAVLSACSNQNGTDQPQLTPEEQTQLYSGAITAARTDEDNQTNAIITTSDDDMAEFIFTMLGVTAEDMEAYAISVSPVNIRAYGVAAVKPAEGKEEAVQTGLQGFIDTQKQNFEYYLADQYEIASNARIETLEDGTVLLVMCENQDDVFDAIKAAIEQDED